MVEKRGVDPRRQHGAEAEDIACSLLTQQGYRIVERNFRCRAGELDIIAVEGSILVFVEVRSRANDRFGGATVGRSKQQQVSRVAALYLALRKPSARHMRFDVITVTAGSATLIRDAWRLGDLH